MILDTISTPLLRQAAALAAGAQHYPAGSLYVVATPIGNLADLTLRAIHVLGRVDAVACEDKRVTAALLQHLGLQVPLLSVHEHNEESAAAGIVDRLAQGQRVAYVSDAGTPAVSDPGARLVAAVRAAGHRVVPVPGASAVVTALSAAGDGLAEGFRFVGFLPPKAQARKAAARGLSDERGSGVLFEAPHRIEALAATLAEELPDRTVTVCRELTKQFEQVHTLSCARLPAWLAADDDRRRGEFVLVLHGRPDGGSEADRALSPAERALLLALMAHHPLRLSVDLVADATGFARKALYAQALILKAERDAEADPTDEHGAGAPDAGRRGEDDPRR